MEKNKLKELVKSYFNLVEEVEEFASAKLVDGTEITYEGELEEGTEVFVVGEDGEKSPAPDAVHELEDGTKVATVDGKVVVEEEEEAAAEEEEEVEAKDEDKEEMSGEGPSAYLQLPVGEHLIDGKIYTVEEVIDQEGTENEYKKNVIVSIVPQEEVEAKEDEDKEEMSSEEKESEEEKEEFSIDQITDVIVKSLEPVLGDIEELKSKFEKLEGEESSEPTKYSKQQKESNLDPSRQAIVDRLKSKLKRQA